MVKLAPSILSCNFANLQADLDQTRGTGLEIIHIDVMDGIFVPNISFGFKVISDIRDKNDYEAVVTSERDLSGLRVINSPDKYSAGMKVKLEDIKVDGD